MARALKKSRSGRGRSESTGGPGRPEKAPGCPESPFALLSMTPFAAKKQAPVRKEQGGSVAHPPPVRQAGKQPDDAEESALFLEAMRGTRPFSGAKKMPVPGGDGVAGRQGKPAAEEQGASASLAHAAFKSTAPASPEADGSGNPGSEFAHMLGEYLPAPGGKHANALRRFPQNPLEPECLGQDQSASGREAAFRDIPSGTTAPFPFSGGSEPGPGGTEGEGLFLQAMADVSPVRSRGRDLSPPPESREKARALAVERLDELLSGKLEFALEYSEEYIEGHVLGLDAFILGKLRAGQYSPEAHLDLHGLNIEQAFSALVQFIKAAYTGGKRHLILITGRGRNSPGGTPVLRERVQVWLTRDPLKRVVLAFCSARRCDGGAGALYLLLRKRKKQGKIIWDRLPSGEELLL